MANKKVAALILAMTMGLSGSVLALAEGTEATTEAAAEAVTQDAEPFILGGKFPDFTADTTSGTVSLSETLKDKEAVLLVFWATWCGPCENEFPFIQKIYEELGDKLAVIALSTDPRDTMEAIKQYQEEHGLTFPMGRDEEQMFLRTGQTGIPTPVMIDRFGNIGYMQAGSLPEEGANNLVNAFLGDHYTETITFTALPETRTKIEYPAESELANALNGEGQKLQFTNDPNGYDWPFVPETIDGRNAVSASNNEESLAKATVCTHVTANEGDALAFDFDMDTVFGGFLEVTDNKALVKSIGGTHDWSTWTIPLSEGEHDICISFDNRPVQELNAEGKKIYAALSNVRLLSGDEAAAVLEALPKYPTPDKNDIKITNDEAVKVNAIIKEGDYAGENLFKVLAGSEAVVANDNTVRLQITLDDKTDPDAAIIGNNMTGETVLISSLLNEDGTAFEYEYTFNDSVPVLSLLMLPQDYIKTGGSGSVAKLILPDEQTASDYIDLMNTYVGAEIETTFEPCNAKQEEETSEATYTIKVVDQNGDPVPEAVVNMCTDTFCNPGFADANGVISYTGEKQNYHLQVLQVPEGYSIEGVEELYTNAETDITITVTKN